MSTSTPWYILTHGEYAHLDTPWYLLPTLVMCLFLIPATFGVIAYFVMRSCNRRAYRVVGWLAIIVLDVLLMQAAETGSQWLAWKMWDQQTLHRLATDPRIESSELDRVSREPKYHLRVRQSDGSVIDAIANRWSFSRSMKSSGMLTLFLPISIFLICLIRDAITRLAQRRAKRSSFKPSPI